MYEIVMTIIIYRNVLVHTLNHHLALRSELSTTPALIRKFTEQLQHWLIVLSFLSGRCTKPPTFV